MQLQLLVPVPSGDAAARMQLQGTQVYAHVMGATHCHVVCGTGLWLCCCEAGRSSGA
jgi:hypothetical protein